VKPEPEPAPTNGASSGLRPGDDYNVRGDSRADLERHGWKYLRPGVRGELWARPGVNHTSATCFPDGSLYVFSMNAEPGPLFGGGSAKFATLREDEGPSMAAGCGTES